MAPLSDRDLCDDAKIRIHLVEINLSHNNGGWVMWDGAAELLLLRLRAAGRSIADLQALFRDKQAQWLVQRIGKILSIGIEPKDAPQYAARKWEPDEEDSLMEMWNRTPRCSFEHMGRTLQRSPWACYCRLERMHLVKCYSTADLESDRCIEWCKTELTNLRELGLAVSNSNSSGTLSSQGDGANLLSQSVNDRRRLRDGGGGGGSNSQGNNLDPDLTSVQNPRRLQAAKSDLQYQRSSNNNNNGRALAGGGDNDDDPFSVGPRNSNCNSGGATRAGAGLVSEVHYVDQDDEATHRFMKMMFPENYLLEDIGFFGQSSSHESLRHCLLRAPSPRAASTLPTLPAPAPPAQASGAGADCGAGVGVLQELLQVKDDDIRSARVEWLARRAASAAAAAAAAAVTPASLTNQSAATQPQHMPQATQAQRRDNVYQNSDDDQQDTEEDNGDDGYDNNNNSSHRSLAPPPARHSNSQQRHQQQQTQAHGGHLQTQQQRNNTNTNTNNNNDARLPNAQALDPLGRIAEMGFTDRGSIERALLLAGGDVRQAVNLLMDGDLQ